MAMHQNQKLPSIRHLSQRRRRRHFEEKAVQWCCSNEKRLTVVGALISRRWADSRSKICYSQTSNRNHLRQRLLSCSCCAPFSLSSLDLRRTVYSIHRVLLNRACNNHYHYLLILQNLKTSLSILQEPPHPSPPTSSLLHSDSQTRHTRPMSAGLVSI